MFSICRVRTGLEKSLKNGSVLEKSLKNGSVLEKSLKNGSVLEKSLKNGSVLEKSLKNGSVLEKSLKNGSVLEKSLKNGSVLEKSLNFEILAFVLEKSLIFFQKCLENLQLSLNFCLNLSEKLEKKYDIEANKQTHGSPSV